MTDLELPIFDWYLLCTVAFSDKEVRQIKAGVNAFMSNREKDALHYDFLNWNKKPNEIIVWTMYAYEELSIPKHFNIIFQLDNTDNFIEKDYVIKQVVFNNWMATNHISRGHKHIAILEFENSIPDIFNLLPDLATFNSDKKTIQLGFCNKDHFEMIKSKINQTPA